MLEKGVEILQHLTATDKVGVEGGELGYRNACEISRKDGIPSSDLWPSPKWILAARRG